MVKSSTSCVLARSIDGWISFFLPYPNLLWFTLLYSSLQLLLLLLILILIPAFSPFP